MRVAVPIFNGRVSPVFDWALKLLVVNRDGHGEKSRRVVALEGLAASRRPARLQELAVVALLCGGISVRTAEMVESQGVRVIAGLAGDAEAVLSAFFAGALPSPEFAMPGWNLSPPPLAPRAGRRCRRRRGRGGRGHGNPT
jgi:predicted Fe-Mo cluster-binding NifX family protein